MNSKAIIIQGLSARDKTFCVKFCEHFVGSRAAKDVGISDSHASSWANQQLKREDIRSHIKLLCVAAESRSTVTVDSVIVRLNEVVERCLQHTPVRDFHGKPLVVEVPVGCVPGDSCYDSGVVNVGAVYRFDSKGANNALVALGKHLGMFTINHKITTDITPTSEFPLDQLSPGLQLEIAKEWRALSKTLAA